MKSRSAASLRAPGQRSIPSTFLFRSLPKPKCESNSKEGSNAQSSQGSSKDGVCPLVSLSTILDRNSHSASVLPTNKVESEKLLRLLGSKFPNGSIAKGDQIPGEGPKKETRPVIQDSVFKLFSHKPDTRVLENSSSDDISELERSEGDVKKHSKSHVLVLGDDPKPRKRTSAELSRNTKRSRPFYNHYENGTGWWDSEREGIDEDEVGCKEIWEGRGSATLGGLRWD